MMKDAGTKVEKRLQARRSSMELANLNILTTSENDKDHVEIVSDAVARRRNSSVEVRSGEERKTDRRAKLSF